MKFVIVLVALFAVALAAPPTSDVQVLRSESDVGPENFSYVYETSDGTQAEAKGELKNAGSENEAITITGSYKYTAPDGQLIEVKYVADENGFQPIGAHIPTA